MKEKIESPNKYLIISIQEKPNYEIKGEAFLVNKIIKRSPIYHNWIKNERSEIIGIKISTYMISTLKLSSREKELIRDWGKLESDLEVFFGDNKKKDEKSISEDTVSYTTLVKLENDRHGISFPLFGETLDKKEMEKLEANLLTWKSESA